VSGLPASKVQASSPGTGRTEKPGDACSVKAKVGVWALSWKVHEAAGGSPPAGSLSSLREYRFLRLSKEPGMGPWNWLYWACKTTICRGGSFMRGSKGSQLQVHVY